MCQRDRLAVARADLVECRGAGALLFAFVLIIVARLRRTERTGRAQWLQQRLIHWGHYPGVAHEGRRVLGAEQAQYLVDLGGGQFGLQVIIAEAGDAFFVEAQTGQEALLGSGRKRGQRRIPAVGLEVLL